MVCLQTAVMWDMLTTSFTSWLSQELSYSQTCVVTIKHPQISMMNTNTHLSLHNKFETHKQTDLQHNIAFSKHCHFLSGSGSVTRLRATLCCLKAWSPTWQLNHNHQSVLSAPAPASLPLISVPRHWHQHISPHRAALNINTHGETGYF